MEWLEQIFEAFSNPIYWLTVLFFGSLITFIISTIFGKIISNQSKKRGIEYSQIAVVQIQKTAVALQILSAVAVAAAIGILIFG